MLGVGGVFFSATDKPKIVISYKTEVEAEMLQLCDELREQFGEREVVHGLCCEPGHPWDHAYFEWLNHGVVLLMCLSSNYFMSAACRDEFENAICEQVPDPKSTDRVVIPIVLTPLLDHSEADTPKTLKYPSNLLETDSFEGAAAEDSQIAEFQV